MKWSTETWYVDVETGEQLDRSRVKKEYDIMCNSTYTFKKNIYKSIKCITYECRKRERKQGELFGEGN